MKSILVCLFISLLMAGCSTEVETGVPLFNGISFDLKDTEKIVALDDDKKEKFNAYFENRAIQIPLFRCIEANNYLIFIGIPYNTSLAKLADYSTRNTFTKAHAEQTADYFYQRYHNQDEYISVYAQDFDDNLLYILTVANSAALADSLFNAKALANRLNP